MACLASGAILSASPQLSPIPALSPQSALLDPLSKTIRGRHVDVTPSSSPEVVAPGRPLTLTADVSPKAGVHVYAPGNASYTPVTLDVAPQPGLTIGALKYPKATTYFFAPLKERVQVYSSPFRLERTVTVGGSGIAAAKGGPVTLKATFAYQACDDTVCYLPQELALTWTVLVRP